MKRIHILLPILVLLLVSASCKEIRDFFKAIEKYGYRSSQPLGGKNILFDKELLGGFVYNDLPVVITRRDDYTCTLIFLNTELDGIDKKVDAFLSRLGGKIYLNLDMGGYYCFMKIDQNAGSTLEVSLLKSSLSSYVPEKDIRNWLAAHPGEIAYADADQGEVDIFYPFRFQKVSIEKAYEIQAGVLLDKKTKLFDSCDDLSAYDYLEKKYPGDPMLARARSSVFAACVTIEDYQAYIFRFPEDPLVRKANERIASIRLFKADSNAWVQARNVNTFESYENCLSFLKTKEFADSATRRLGILADSIRMVDVQWVAAGNNYGAALELIYRKLQYSRDFPDSGWFLDKMLVYTLQSGNPDLNYRTMDQFDRLAARKPSKDDMLWLFMYRGFLYWGMDSTEKALAVFRAGSGSVFESSGEDFGAALRKKQWQIHELGIVLPKEKALRRKIRKI